MSWNPVVTAEVAFTLEDGSVGVVDTSQGSPGAKNDLDATIVRQAEGGGGLARCQWSNHPRIFYVTQGDAISTIVPPGCPRTCRLRGW
jgi:hypothetical protein